MLFKKFSNYAVISVAIFWFGVLLVYVFQGITISDTISEFSGEESSRFLYYLIMNVLSWTAWLLYFFKYFNVKYKRMYGLKVLMILLLIFQIVTVFTNANIESQEVLHNLSARAMFVLMFIITLIFSRLPSFGNKSFIFASTMILSSLFWDSFNQYSLIGQSAVLLSFHCNWIFERRSE